MERKLQNNNYTAKVKGVQPDMYVKSKPHRGMAFCQPARALRNVGIFGFAAFTLIPVLGHAQTPTEAQPQSAFNRDRNISVQDRPRPEYENQGLRRGAFIWRPSLNSYLAYSDNVFASDEGEEADGLLTLQPTIRVASDWSSNRVDAFANLLHQEYFENSGESTTGYAFGASGQLDASRAVRFEAGADYRRAFEGRTVIGASQVSLDPIEFGQSNGFLGVVREFGRTRLSADGTVLTTDYKDAALLDGTEIDQDFRDQTQLGFAARADYAFSPETAFFARAAYIDVDHDELPVTGQRRDRETINARVGVDFELSRLVRGQVGLGYFTTDFLSAELDTVDGFGFDAELEWFATPLITLTTSGERGTRSSELLISPATTQTRFGLKADYEYRRNIIFSAGYDFIDDDYNFADRSDERNDFYLAGLVLLNPNIGLEARLSRRSLDSQGTLAQSDFDETRLLFGLRWQL